MAKKKPKRKPPVSLSPLSFNDAVGGLLAVDPAKVAKPRAKKKTVGTRRKK